ncbi:hypothetical protein G7Y89_g8596 [Cudoniella acicularis]|uniref:Stress-response A/B barrel domain-containing protein n=1 Tax=Cudoniella acicularis TaxID=354080 RepID=A0A8H4W2R1_9HELO|nr:hypothetical protein G7Y89_g8596 [Cudoniella acicularis]
MEFNPDCEEMIFVAAFNTEDPGINTPAESLFMLDDKFSGLALELEFLPSADIEKYRDLVPATLAQGVESCLKRALYTFKPELSASYIQESLANMLRLKDRCLYPLTGKPYVLSMIASADPVPGNPYGGGYTHGLLMTFASREDWNYYRLEDPAHKEFIATITSYLSQVKLATKHLQNALVIPAFYAIFIITNNLLYKIYQFDLHLDLTRQLYQLLIESYQTLAIYNYIQPSTTMYQRTTNLLLALSAFSFLPAIALTLPPPDNACEVMKDRTFRIISMTRDGSSSLTQTRQAILAHNYDSSDTIEAGISSCFLNWFGSGCKWQKFETSDLGSPKFSTPSTATAIFDPNSESVLYTADARCGVTAPASVSSDSADDLKTVVFVHGTLDEFRQIIEDRRQSGNQLNITNICETIPTKLPTGSSIIIPTEVAANSGERIREFNANHIDIAKPSPNSSELFSDLYKWLPNLRDAHGVHVNLSSSKAILQERGSVVLPRWG